MNNATVKDVHVSNLILSHSDRSPLGAGMLGMNIEKFSYQKSLFKKIHF